MSRLGKKGIDIPDKTEIVVDGGNVRIKGPKGELSRTFKPVISIKVAEGHVDLELLRKDKESRSLWGTYASHISNMVQGVNEPFQKKLIIEGVGYKAEVVGKNLKLIVGFSHPVEIEIPEGLEVAVEKDSIVIKGIDKEAVGQFAANVRSKKKPEPYKGKGIRYDGEIIRRKEGKKTV